jgi:hypothetical protein
LDSGSNIFAAQGLFAIAETEKPAAKLFAGSGSLEALDLTFLPVSLLKLPVRWRVPLMVMVDAMTKCAARVVAQLVVLDLILSHHFEGSVYTRHSAPLSNSKLSRAMKQRHR